MERKQGNIHADKLKSVLITRTAIKTLASEDIVEKVIMFQFKDFRDLVNQHEQIEVSGFGKFMTSPSKIRKRIEALTKKIEAMDQRLAEEEEGSPKREYYRKVIDDAKKTVAYLETRKGGYEL